MTTFKEFLLNEQPAAVFSQPVNISVNLNNQIRQFEVDVIDVRSEDWNLENPMIRTDYTTLRRSPKTLVKPFSLPLADGKFINADFYGAEIEPNPKYPHMLGRPDWAKFAQFVLDNKVVKQPKFQNRDSIKNPLFAS